MSLYTLNEKTQRRGLFHIKSNAKVYLNDEKKSVDPRLHLKRVGQY
jgi:hypothetical protein